MTTDQLRRFFEEPGAHLLLALDYTIIDAGPEYLRTTYTRREDIVGKSVLEIVDDSTHKQYNGSLRQSLARVAETREPDKMPPQRYAVLKRTGEGDKTEHSPRWLKVTNIPIFEHGQMTSIVQRIEDVTLEMETARTVAGLRRRTNVFYAAVVVLFVAFALGLTIAVNRSNDASHEAQMASSAVKAQVHTTCVIQARGLPAGHQLADSFVDLHELLNVLLALPSSSPARPVPKPDRQRTVRTGSTGLTGTVGLVLRGFAVNLNDHLGRYLAAEEKQPASRKCPAG